MIKLDNYIMIDLVAQGGIGSIYRALQGNGNPQRIVAVKFIKLKYSQRADFKKMFKEEVQAIFPLVHPNIAQCYASGEEKGQLYCVMEYVDGINLKSLLEKLKAKKKKLPLELSMFIINEASKGLLHAHELSGAQVFGQKQMGLIHRDVSPHNIMVTYDGHVKVIDFGMAKAKLGSTADKTEVGTLKGKPSYMAPEYIRGKHYDHRIDQFALGIIFWEMVTGARLFEGENTIEVIRKIDKCEIPLPRFYNEEINHDLQEIILKMLAPLYRKRYASMAQVDLALRSQMSRDYHGPEELKNFLEMNFKKEMQKNRENLKGQIHQALINNAMTKDEAGLLTFQRGRKAS